MEQKLNITEILKEKAPSTKLWSPLFGDVYFSFVSINLVTVFHHKTSAKFYLNAKLYNYDEAEPALFPSKEMRDWFKFAWKKGDVLVSREGSKILFDKWANEDYTKFLGKIKVLGNSHCYDTANYSLASKEEALEFIKSVEEINNGKLNLETLRIEKSEFKDGDIVVAEEDNYYDRVIFIAAIKDDIVSKALINVRYEDYEVNYNEYRFGHNRKLRLATDSEKKQLFSALKKEGKRWDSEKKQIVDLKPKVKLKPFDKVIVRCSKADKWSIDFFSYKVSNGYICTGDAWFGYCLPYNEETAHLLGTTNEWKGGDYD